MTKRAGLRSTAMRTGYNAVSYTHASLLVTGPSVPQSMSPLPKHQSVVLLLHPALFSTCPLACRRERDVLTAHSAETPQGERTHPSTVANALNTPPLCFTGASLGLGTAQTASGSGTNISCNTPLCYMLFVSFVFVRFCSLCVPFVSCSCTCMCVVTLFYVVHACMHIVHLLGFVMCVLSCRARSVDLHVVPDGNSTLCAG